ncbi:MAG TPA: sugar phosphate nucleotidyltransferase [Phycisphaerae bacterium]|nr:sugar phosphate nucleotidyltransferase [Phycisphaerae bacterium]
MKAVILAGGRGTRLAPYTAALPKPLVPVGDVPILEIIIRRLIASGCTSITLSLGHMGELIRSYLGAQKTLASQIEIECVDEEEPTGTAGSLRLVPNLPETFLVTNGDVLTTLDYQKLMAFHKDNGAMLTIAGYRKQIQIDLGVLKLNGDKSEVVDYIEKPRYIYPVSMGIYVYDRRVLDYIPPVKYFDFPDLVLRLLAEKCKVSCYEADAIWLDIGRRDDYLEAQEVFLKNKECFITPPKTSQYGRKNA